MIKSKWKLAILLNVIALVVLLLHGKEEKPKQRYEVAQSSPTEPISLKKEVTAQTAVMPQRPSVSLEHPRDMTEMFPPILPRDAAMEITKRVEHLIASHPEEQIGRQLRREMDQKKLFIWFNRFPTPFTYRHIYLRDKWVPTMFVSPQLFMQLDPELLQMGIWHEYQHHLHTREYFALRDAHRKSSLGIALTEEEAHLLVEDELKVCVDEARLAVRLDLVRLMPGVYGFFQRSGEGSYRKEIATRLSFLRHIRPYAGKLADWADNPIPLH